LTSESKDVSNLLVDVEQVPFLSGTDQLTMVSMTGSSKVEPLPALPLATGALPIPTYFSCCWLL